MFGQETTRVVTSIVPATRGDTHDTNESACYLVKHLP